MRIVVAEAKPTTFILEDDPDNQESMTMIVATMQLSTECYSTVREFLDSYDTTRPGCLILDVRLPGMSGLDCLEKLQTDGSQLPCGRSHRPR